MQMRQQATKQISKADERSESKLALAKKFLAVLIAQPVAEEVLAFLFQLVLVLPFVLLACACVWMFYSWMVQ